MPNAAFDGCTDANGPESEKIRLSFGLRGGLGPGVFADSRSLNADGAARRMFEGQRLRWRAPGPLVP